MNAGSCATLSAPVKYHPSSQATFASGQGRCGWGVGRFNSRHLHDDDGMFGPQCLAGASGGTPNDV